MFYFAEKRKRQRMEETQGRQREFQERFNTSAASLRTLPSGK
jgi:hypothetical protein